LFVCGLLATPHSFADSYARIVRLSDIDGSVEIDRNTGSGFEKAIQNMPITQGVRLKTGSSGRAEIEFENGSVFRLASDSEVEFSQLALRSNGDRISEMRVNEGTVYVAFRHKGGDDFRVTAGNHSFDLTHDARFRMHLSHGQAELAVFKGEVEVQEGSQIAKVKKNETLAFNLDDVPKFALAKGVDTLATDDYDRERAEYLQQYASSSHGSPYSYGYSDLYRYGNFFNAPGYGLVWQPYYVGSGWDPFSNGYWSYYPTAGYVFISSYPWGWTPYRFGQWTFLNGYGWVWRPGGWNQWNSGVVVVNPPATWRRPIPPARGVVTTVPIGNPVPVRTFPTNIGPRRIDRMNPHVSPIDRSQARPGATPGVPTNSVANQPAQGAAKAPRDFGMGTDRGSHHEQSGAPAQAAPRPMSPPSAPASRPAAPAHASPKAGDTAFQSGSHGFSHAGGASRGAGASHGGRAGH
jgi:hypothetical protein